MVLDGITSSNVIHIRAQFPKVRYFSYQVSQPVCVWGGVVWGRRGGGGAA